MFDVNVKNVTKKGREGKGRRGPARVWGFDNVPVESYTYNIIIIFGDAGESHPHPGSD